MNYYEMKWKERKGFLISSSIMGSIVSFVFVIIVAFRIGFKSISEVFEAALTLVLLALLFTAIIVLVRMIRNGGGAGENFAINILCGLFTAMANCFTGSGVGIVIGLAMMMFFGFLFFIVAAVYSIYFPISTIYYYIMYKKEAK